MFEITLQLFVFNEPKLAKQMFQIMKPQVKEYCFVYNNAFLHKIKSNYCTLV